MKSFQPAQKHSTEHNLIIEHQKLNTSPLSLSPKNRITPHSKRPSFRWSQPGSPGTSTTYNSLNPSPVRAIKAASNSIYHDSRALQALHPSTWRACVSFREIIQHTSGEQTTAEPPKNSSAESTPTPFWIIYKIDWFINYKNSFECQFYYFESRRRIVLLNRSTLRLQSSLKWSSTYQTLQAIRTDSLHFMIIAPALRMNLRDSASKLDVRHQTGKRVYPNHSGEEVAVEGGQASSRNMIY